jgi:hypothetical protein
MRGRLGQIACLGVLLATLLLLTLAATASAEPARPAAAAPSVEVVFQHGVGGYAGGSDAYVEFFSPDSNFCSEQLLLVSGIASRSALLRFDVSSIASNADIVEAYLEVNAAPEGAVGPLEVGAYGLSESWTECEATWTHATTANAWQVPGALGAQDGAAVASDKELLSGPGWCKFNVTRLVRNWVQRDALNQGVMLRSTDPRGAEVYKFISNAHPSSELHPRLRVLYSGTCAAPTPVPLQQIVPTGVMTFQQGLDGYSACSDTFIDSNVPGMNYGSDQVLLVRGRRNTSTLVQFDVSSLPPQIMVVEAYLQLWARSDSAVLPLEVACHPVLRPWDASVATWLNATAREAWAAPGCQDPRDRIDPPSDREILHGAAWWQFNVTHLVQDWLDSSVTNHGFLLESPDDTSSATYKFTSSNHDDTASYPILVVSYAPRPEPPGPTPAPVRSRVYLPIILRAR